MSEKPEVPPCRYCGERHKDEAGVPEGFGSWKHLVWYYASELVVEIEGGDKN